ncbi:MAG TPA: histidine phosphatase family protein [Acidobacteriaceae bacterium]|jgi:probable phosphoglycerate mutase|nr:histidine phosphatase family protein [Acidobacteriaceae bacterium]
MSPVALYLVRHGAIISVAKKAYIGQIEAPLSEEGVEQAWALRRWLEPVPFNRVVSSDLSRSQRTAKIILGRRAIAVEPMPALREINLGEWEGFSFQEIREKFPEEYAARGSDIENFRPPRGESFADCRERVNASLHRILAASQGNVLMAGHAGVNRLILCSILGIPVGNLHSIGQDYGCLNVIEWGPDRTRVQLMNFTPRSPRSAQSASLRMAAARTGKVKPGNTSEVATRQ